MRLSCALVLHHNDVKQGQTREDDNDRKKKGKLPKNDNNNNNNNNNNGIAEVHHLNNKNCLQSSEVRAEIPPNNLVTAQQTRKPSFFKNMLRATTTQRSNSSDHP
jgi:hypothetical protein